MDSQKPTVFIDGAEGTTGLLLAQRLQSHGGVTLLQIDPALRKDPQAKKEMIAKADLTVLCLPDGAARESVALAGENDRVLDASTAHRVDPGFLYGLPELMEDGGAALREAKRASVPGCHATGFLLGVTPLVRAGLISPDAALTCYSLTGYSGGGKKMIADYEAETRPVEQEDGLTPPRPYALGQQHKHLPEMAKIAGLKNPPVFCPVVGDFLRGMAVTVFLPAGICDAEPEEVRQALEEAYAGCQYVRVEDPPANGFIDPCLCNETNDAVLYVCGVKGRMTVTCVIDNLGKGSSGAAVQCIELMLGLENR